MLLVDPDQFCWAPELRPDIILSLEGPDDLRHWIEWIINGRATPRVAAHTMGRLVAGWTHAF